MTAASGSSAPAANGSQRSVVADPASSPTSVDVGAGRGPAIGFGRRNPHCSNCGDERGGPFGHETSECQYRSGMTTTEVAQLLPEHRRGEFWELQLDRYFEEQFADPAVSRTLHVAEQTAAMNREAGR